MQCRINHVDCPVGGRVSFKRGVKDENVESKTEKYGVQNSICILQEIRYFEPLLISFNTIFTHRPSKIQI